MTSIQTALIIQNCRAGFFEHNLAQTLDFISQSARSGAKIIVFPEGNLTGYVTGKEVLSISRALNGDIIKPLSRIAVDLKVTILTGLAEKTNQNEIFATHLVFTPDGSFQRYRKIHTAPFEKTYYSAGNDIVLFKSHGLRFGIQLCYDAHFPELSLAMALNGADIIFIPHASPRGTCQEKYDSWLRHLTARAFDNGIYVAACNQIGDNLMGLSFPGISILIGPDGNVVSDLKTGKQNIHMVLIDTDKIKEIRSHKMRYFLPNRRQDLFKF
ncbi:MAG: amidohydrolase [Desulfobacula sp.]|nr:amidohydrolase [Desulfobacula sp.]